MPFISPTFVVLPGLQLPTCLPVCYTCAPRPRATTPRIANATESHRSARARLADKYCPPPSSLLQPCPHMLMHVYEDRSAGYDDVDTYPRFHTNILRHMGRAHMQHVLAGVHQLPPPPSALRLRACRLRPTSAPSSLLPPRQLRCQHTCRLRRECSLCSRHE